jgi:protein transport protein SEC61 subunit gamma-like protein
VSKKPDREEFQNVAKITGLGIILIGVIGFVISLIAQLTGSL